jgi:hypothetical protein
MNPGVFNERNIQMEDLARTPQSNHEPTPPEGAPVTNTPPQPSPAGSSSGGCLKGASITLGILSSAVSVLFIVSYAMTSPEGALGLAAIFFVIWLPLGALPGLLSCICAGVYTAPKPSKQGSVPWPMLIGGLAVILGLVTLGLVHVI